MLRVSVSASECSFSACCVFLFTAVSLWQSRTSRWSTTPTFPGKWWGSIQILRSRHTVWNVNMSCTDEMICLCFNEGPRWKQVSSSADDFLSAQTNLKAILHILNLIICLFTILPFHSAIVSATLKCLMKFYNITDNVRMVYIDSTVVISPICYYRNLCLIIEALLQTTWDKRCPNQLTRKSR